MNKFNIIYYYKTIKKIKIETLYAKNIKKLRDPQLWGPQFTNLVVSNIILFQSSPVD